ncbi:hypothetical protein BC830DRAFT_1137859, partial [Chytriomyces sp. MP71]
MIICVNELTNSCVYANHSTALCIIKTGSRPRSVRGHLNPKICLSGLQQEKQDSKKMKSALNLSFFWIVVSATPLAVLRKPNPTWAATKKANMRTPHGLLCVWQRRPRPNVKMWSVCYLEEKIMLVCSAGAVCKVYPGLYAACMSEGEYFEGAHRTQITAGYS